MAGYPIIITVKCDYKEFLRLKMTIYRNVPDGNSYLIEKENKQVVMKNTKTMQNGMD